MKQYFTKIQSDIPRYQQLMNSGGIVFTNYMSESEVLFYGNTVSILGYQTKKQQEELLEQLEQKGISPEVLPGKDETIFSIKRFDSKLPNLEKKIKD